MAAILRMTAKVYHFKVFWYLATPKNGQVPSLVAPPAGKHKCHLLPPKVDLFHVLGPREPKKAIRTTFRGGPSVTPCLSD